MVRSTNQSRIGIQAGCTGMEAGRHPTQSRPGEDKAGVIRRATEELSEDRMTEPLPTYDVFNPDDYINLLLQRIDTMCDMIDQLRQERTMLLLQRDEMLKKIGENDDTL